MKYLTAIFLFLCPFYIAQATRSSSNSENCSHATQGIHTVSENDYKNFLARLTGDATTQRKVRKKLRNRQESSGQR